MKRIVVFIAISVLSTQLFAQNYFLNEIQKNPTDNLRSGIKLRMKEYLDSLKNIETGNDLQFDSDSDQKAYYQKIISNIDFSIKNEPENAENYLIKGIYQSALYKYDSAEMCINKAIELDPDYDQAYLERGVLNLMLYETKDAISDFKKALKINPQYTDAVYNLGYTYLQEGKINQAKKYFEKAIELNPYAYQSYIQLGYVYFLQQDFYQSVSNYSKAIEINPFEPLGYNLRGQLYLYQGNIEHAQKDFKKSYSIDPNNYSVIFILALIDFEFGNLNQGIELISEGTRLLNNFTSANRINDYAEAEMNDIIVHYAQYTKKYPAKYKKQIGECIKNLFQNQNFYHVQFVLQGLIDADQSLVLPKRLLLYVYYQTGRILNYQEQIDELLKQDSTLAFVNILNAAIHQENKKFDLSLKYIDRALETEPDYAYGYAMRAWSNFQLGRYTNAYDDVERSLQDVDPFLYAINVKAIILDALRKYDESTTFYNLAINYYPGQAFLYSNRALTYYELKNYDKAIDDCEKSIDLDPYNPLPYTTLGNIYVDIGKKRKALKYFDQALETEPNHIFTLYNKADAYLKWDKPNKAIELFKKAIESNSLNNDLYIGLADVYMETEDYENAIVFSTKAIEIDPESLNGYRLRARAKSFINQHESAITDLDLILSRDSLNIATIFEKARIYSDIEEIERSTHEYKKIIQIDSTYSIAYGNIGWNYYLKGDYNECVLWSEKAIEKDNKMMYAKYNIALAYLCMNEFEKSKSLYKKYLEENKQIGEPLNAGAIEDLEDLIEKGMFEDEAGYILKNIFKAE